MACGKARKISLKVLLRKERSITTKLRALKTQFNFRKQVWTREAIVIKNCFYLLKVHGQQYTVKELMDNLAQLINEEETVSGVANEERESLAGKIIKHKWRDESGVEQWCFGEVLSKVAGTNEWYNVQYEGFNA